MILPQNPLSYYADFLPIAESVNATLLMSYFFDRIPDGEWVSITQAQIISETGITRWEQETARHLLREKNVLLEAKRGVPMKLYFFIDRAKLLSLMSNPSCRAACRAGYVYLLKSQGLFKIGFTRNIKQRHTTLQIGSTTRIDIIHSIPCEQPSVLEKFWHDRFADQRVKGEWFHLSDEDVTEFCAS
jgi:hypothetical protein